MTYRENEMTKQIKITVIRDGRELRVHDVRTDGAEYPLSGVEYILPEYFHRDNEPGLYKFYVDGREVYQVTFGEK